ncbi:MAG: putative bifunctional diguanylate cyclase/phosphodiesterase, partial [Oceanobacter sp.]
LANRRFALEYLSQSMSSHQRDQQFGAVLFVDLDHFKSINDSMGHHVGDEVLTQLATRLRYSVSDQAFCARLGGDEFLVILENLNKNQRDTIVQASLIANKILQVFNQPVPCQNYQYHLSASIGISIFPQPELAPGDAVRQADTAMYYAKSSGRNRFRLYSSDMQTISHQRLALVNDLHLALKEEAFEIYFQPQVNQRGELVAAEALCRWNHRGKILEPSSFISMAEESNLIVPLGQWIIQKSLDVLQSWKSSGCLPNTFQRLALNVSPQQFLDPHFAANLIEALANRNLNAGDIELEITESVLLENTQAVLDSILELSEIGFSIALDDFGKGYSSLSYLKSLPVNTLKIDRAFVAEIDQPGNLNLLVDYVIQLGHSLGIKILAEGVESDRQKSYLAERDCHLYQGFLFSQPMSESDFLKHLERSNH